MAAQSNDGGGGDEHETARRMGSRIGRLLRGLTRSRSREMTKTSGQLGAATAPEPKSEISEREDNNDLVFKMQPRSRRHVKIRVLAYREAEPRLAYDELSEETAAVQ